MDDVLEPVVAEGLHLPAVAADEVVMVVAAGRRGLVLGAPRAELDSMDEAELAERLQSAVDAGDAHTCMLPPDEVVDLLRGETAGLRSERADHSGPGAARFVAGVPQHGLGVCNPTHRHKMIAILIPASVPAMLRIVLVLALLAPFAAACGGDDDAGGSTDKTDVVAAFYPLAWAAEEVGGEDVRVTNLTPTGAEPHDAELTARDVERIRAADAVFHLGGGFQPALEAAVEDAAGEVVDLLQDTVAGDPHVWLDPVRFEAMATRIANTLGGPADATRLNAELDDLNRDFQAGLSDCTRRELVTAHDAFGYLARRYDLKTVPIAGISPEAEPTPQQLEQVVRQVRQSKATTVFFETLLSPRLAETVARETGARTAVLNPIEGLTEEELERGDTYLTVMRDNLEALRKALGCR